MLRQNTLAMLKKGKVKAQITTAAINSAKETQERNQRVLKKCFSTVYFITRNKWAVKNKFEEVMNHICNLGDADLIKHSPMMAKNPTYMSHFTMDELTKLI